MSHRGEEFVFISDVHANLEALNAVLAEAGERGVYCLGDVVGYGASPNEVIDLLRQRNAVCVLGNHDHAALTADPGGFNARAAVAAVWTSRQLSDDNRLFLAGLPRDFYLTKLSVRLIALGHTHVPFVWSERAGVVFNPGSVGQPRDGDPRSSYAIVSVHGDRVEVEHRRAVYDIETSANKIVEAGLPAVLARRLFTGE
jgi:putative phosphoesterase